MNTEIEKLIESIEQWQKAEDSEKLFEKLVGTIVPGGKVEVLWKDREELDHGYIFTLPGQSIEDGDCFVHVPQMDNSDGMEDGDEIHLHLMEILSNDEVLFVTIKP